MLTALMCGIRGLDVAEFRDHPLLALTASRASSDPRLEVKNRSRRSLELLLHISCPGGVLLWLKR